MRTYVEMADRSNSSLIYEIYGLPFTLIIQDFNPYLTKNKVSVTKRSFLTLWWQTFSVHCENTMKTIDTKKGYGAELVTLTNVNTVLLSVN